jgi:hypothetical protein
LSSIRIRIDEAKSINVNIRQKASSLSNIKQGLSSIRYNMDDSIMAKRNIRARLNNACNSINKLEAQIKSLEVFINNSMDSYCRAEDYIAKSISSFNNSLMTSGSNDKKGNNIGDFLYNNIKDIIKSDQTYGAISTALDQGIISNISKMKKGLNFDIVDEGGQVLIKIAKGKVANNADFEKYRNLFKSELGGSSKWSKSFVTELVNDGVPLYNKQSKTFIDSNINKLINTHFDDLNKYVEGFKKAPTKVMGAAFADTFSDSIKFWDDFRPSQWKGVTKVSAFGKAAGIVSTVITAANDFGDNFHNDETNKWEYSHERLKDFTIDFSIDIAAGTGAMATGAAIGSLILPPLGTVVGAAAGLAINFGINYEFGKPPKSLVDHTQDFLKHPVKTMDGIAPKMDAIFW